MKAPAGSSENELLKPIETARLQTHGPFGKYRLKRIAKPDISERPCTMCIVCRMICVFVSDDLCFIDGRNGKRQKPSALSHYDSLFAGFRTAKGSVIGMVSTKLSHTRNYCALVAEEVAVRCTCCSVCRSIA